MIAILTTGGTIEGMDYKTYQTPAESHVHIEDHLNDIGNLPDYSIVPVFSKDSRFITEQDREQLFEEILKANTDNILITHGTYSMVQTAQYLAQKKLNKTIILTGAFILGDRPDTDAKSNIEYAISQFKKVTRGIFIAIHNETFHWDNVVKNEAIGKFERITKW
ncbi:asparaginase [Aquimarina sp. U1-2]|uniref:asparaginase domain-containing protein n=1 Tax=Aquimarina sp. U1-2 TaxID=2823141 RepID=UPI001AEC7AD0|nr:asparaginase domain-containing protein [Aquimarina sp. U1-2]MBP2831832.1 asparaginase [Aquimarina sp. U1-2]